MNQLFYSAGAVVIGPGNKVLVVSQNNDSWSLPKGHLDPGETPEQAAEREIQEESGIQEIKIIEKLGEYERPRIALGGVGDIPDQPKHITMFLAITNQEDLRPIDPFNPQAEWLAVQDVADRLTHPRDKEFFQSVLPKVLTFIAS